MNPLTLIDTPTGKSNFWANLFVFSLKPVTTAKSFSAQALPLKSSVSVSFEEKKIPSLALASA